MSVPEGAAARYRSAVAEGLRWMLARPALGGGFLNTKVNSITLADYTEAEGIKGPPYTYGWIQGRGLEALTTHAAPLEGRDPSLAAVLDEAAQRLYALLDGLVARDGHAHFLYDAAMHPIRPDGTPQKGETEVYTYSDAFAAKGLVAAAARHAPGDLPRHLAYLDRVVDAIRGDRFHIDETVPLGPALATQPDDFGPRMILLGACGMLHRIGQPQEAAFGAEFLAHVLERHLHPATGLLRTTLQGDECNPGHAIELVGFALDDPTLADDQMAQGLTDLLVTTFDAGFTGPGVALSLDIESRAPRNPLCPWWSLPEAIRAAALAYQRTGDLRAAEVWHEADNAFFSDYWREGHGLAYQTLGPDGPVDFTPATPDLDPGYHTGLSLLRAAQIAEHPEVPHGSG